MGLPTIGRPNISSVRFRTTLGAVVALTMVLAIGLGAIGWLVGRQVRLAADATLLEQATDRARLLDDGADPTALVNVVGDEVVVAVLAADGEVLASTGTPEPRQLGSLTQGVTEVRLELVHEADEGHDADRTEIEPIRAAAAETGDGSLVVVGNEGERASRTINATWTVLATTGPVIVAAGAAVAWLVTGRALAPVYRMRRDLTDVVARSPESRVGEPGTDDEIQALAVTINEVLGRLQRQSDARRRFVADASHELKSPLANARAIVETGRSIDDGDTGALLGELNRLQDLVDDLLYLARTDETVRPRTEPFDLDDVVFDEAERASIRTEVRIDASGVRPCRASADQREVARAIRNLLENATRYARDQVAISIEENDDVLVVVITDDGPGIPAADRSRVFDRFTRLDADRSRRIGGTGLGLSIVASIARRNGGDVTIADTPIGTEFRFALPMSDDR